MKIENNQEVYIIQEIDVFLNSNYKKLALFQYPLRPSYRTYNYHECELKMKVNQNKFEMNFNIHENSNYFDMDEFISQQIEYKKESLSSLNVLLKTNYTIGVFRNGELHITPIQKVIQFRPNFYHIDDSENKKKSLKKEEKILEEPMLAEIMEENNNENPNNNENNQNLQPLTVHFKKKESLKAIAARKKSEQKQMEEEEPWIQFNYFVNDSPDSIIEFEKLFCNLYESIHENFIQKEQYLNQLFPFPPESFSIEESKVISKNSLKRLPLDKQILTLLLSANVMHFHKICELVTLTPNSRGEEEILETITKIAVYVRGCWVIKSEFCCESKIRTSRDYLLSLLHINEHTPKSEFQSIIKLPIEIISDLLSKIAIFKTGQGWKLKLDPDLDFIKKYSEVIIKYDNFWNERKKKY
jgi:DNA-directed RNA polymerase-3 subunit RPC5